MILLHTLSTTSSASWFQPSGTTQAWEVEKCKAGWFYSQDRKSHWKYQAIHFFVSEAAFFSTCCFCRLTQQLIEMLSEEVDECPLEQMKYEADKIDNANERVQHKHELHDLGKNNWVWTAKLPGQQQLPYARLRYFGTWTSVAPATALGLL
jgi:hypothetical protein